MEAPASEVFRVKRNSADSPQPLLQGQEDSKIKGVKNIGIISTPIVWPVKQRSLHTRKSASPEEQSPDRKSAPNYFIPTTPEVTSSVPDETQILHHFTEQVNIDHNSSMKYTIFHNISRHSNIFLEENGNPREIPTIPLDHIRNMVFPLQQSKSIDTRTEWIWTSPIEDPKSDSIFSSLVSKNIFYDPTEGFKWLLSSERVTFPSAYSHSFLHSWGAWNKVAIYNHVISGISEENYPFSIQTSSRYLKELFQETAMDLLERSLENIYLEPTKRILEDDTVRNGFYITHELQFTQFNYIRDDNSVKFKNQVHFKQSAYPSGSLQNMKAWFPDVMPGIHQTEVLLPAEYNKELQGFSAVLLERERSPEIHQSISVSSIYGEAYAMASLKSDVVTFKPLTKELEHSDMEASSPQDDFELLNASISYSSYSHPASVPLENIKKSNPNKLAGDEHFKNNNSDGLHNDSSFFTVHPTSMVEISYSWKSSDVSLPTQYVDNTPSTKIHWTLYQEPLMVSEESTERLWFSFSQPFSSLTERVPIFSPTSVVEDISMQTIPSNITASLGDGNVNISTYSSEKNREKIRPLVPISSSMISERKGRASALEITSLPLSTSVLINDISPLYFPLTSLEIPVIQPSLHVQISISDMTNVKFTDGLEGIASLTRQQMLDETPTDYVINSFPYHHEILTSSFEYSCIEGGGHNCTVNILVQSSGNAEGPPQSQNMYLDLWNNLLTSVSDDIKNKESSFMTDAFLEKQNSLSFNFSIGTQSLEIAQSHSLNPQIRAKTSALGSHSSFPTPIVSQSHLSKLNQSLSSSENLWDEEPNQRTNLLNNSYHPDNEQYAKDPENKLSPSLQLDHLEVIGGDINHGGNKPSSGRIILAEDTVWQLQPYSKNHNDSSPNEGLLSSNTTYILATNFIQTISPAFEDFVNYEKELNYSSFLETTAIAVVINTTVQSSTYTEPIKHFNENTLSTEIMTGMTFHPHILEAQISASKTEPEMSAHEKLPTNVLPGVNQTTTPHPSLYLSINSPKSVLSCFLCNPFIDWGCLCGPEVNHSTSKAEARCRKQNIIPFSKFCRTRFRINWG